MAVDGISLTVTEVTDEEFGLGLIPHTLANTTLRAIVPGRRVNLEADVLARYVRQAMLTWAPGAVGDAGPAAGTDPTGGPDVTSATGGRATTTTGGLSEEALRAAGFLD